tara:strand:+ start:619 stop:1035 length:417 start_codon:yes stop_codon:yes gene_type:complete
MCGNPLITFMEPEPDNARDNSSERPEQSEWEQRRHHELKITLPEKSIRNQPSEKPNHSSIESELPWGLIPKVLSRKPQGWESKDQTSCQCKTERQHAYSEECRTGKPAVKEQRKYRDARWDCQTNCQGSYNKSTNFDQ